MKSILMSIQPKWCELIASGKKTIEVRKTRPKLDVPFKVYIYQTKGHGECQLLYSMGKDCLAFKLERSRGQVIGEFICRNIDIIDMIYSENLRQANSAINRILQDSCLSAYELLCYLSRDTADRDGYAYNISDLVIYDKPKGLSEFCGTDNDAVRDCDYRHIVGQPEYKTAHNGWIKGGYYCTKNDDWCSKCKTKPLTRPPQSWRYVEENSL